MLYYLTVKAIAELQKYIPVDIFGSCGDKSCPKSEYLSNGSLLDNPCNTMLVKDYKFYFAFENSICKDYTTEKFWEKINLDVVVVVLCRRILEQYAPGDAFIAVDDFDSAADLAQYLLKLHNNDDLYMNYFKWRTKFEAIFLNGRQHDVKERPWGFCRLCKILWTRPVVRKVYRGQLSEDYWSIRQCYGTVQSLMTVFGDRNNVRSCVRMKNAFFVIVRRANCGKDAHLAHVTAGAMNFQ
uniref:Fucosyltransferase n=1 Tax=Romanomermis culicivorax TaxID=13658 RepID=A0A915JTJ1_ROMCU